MANHPRNHFVAALFNVRNRIRFAMDDAFRPLGITDATWRTLFFLEQEGSGVSQKRLATTMGIEGPSLVRLLDSLEERGLIERRPSQTDRRAKALHLTASADRLLVELHDIATTTREAILADVSDAELKTCMQVFDRILAAAEKRETTWKVNDRPS